MDVLKQMGEPPPSKPNWISAGLNAGGGGFKPRPEQHSVSLGTDHYKTYVGGGGGGQAKYKKNIGAREK